MFTVSISVPLAKRVYCLEQHRGFESLSPKFYSLIPHLERRYLVMCFCDYSISTFFLIALESDGVKRPNFTAPVNETPILIFCAFHLLICIYNS